MADEHMRPRTSKSPSRSGLAQTFVMKGGMNRFRNRRHRQQLRLLLRKCDENNEEQFLVLVFAILEKQGSGRRQLTSRQSNLFVRRIPLMDAAPWSVSG